MDIVELGAIEELVGGVAVIGSLLYVGLQVRQNTRQLKSQVRFHVLDGLNQDSRRLSEKDQWDLCVAQSADHLLLREGDRFQFLWTSWLSRHEIMHYEISEGTLPRAFEKTLRFRLFTTFQADQAQKLWARHCHYFTDAFRSYVEQQLGDGFAEFSDLAGEA